MARKLPAPPSAITGALGDWLRSLHALIEATPNISVASFAAADTPNSRVTGLSGDLCVNIGVESNTSRLWVLGGGSPSALTSQGWARVRVLE